MSSATNLGLGLYQPRFRGGVGGQQQVGGGTAAGVGSVLGGLGSLAGGVGGMFQQGGIFGSNTFNPGGSTGIPAGQFSFTG
jgi:hypothetical protein